MWHTKCKIFITKDVFSFFTTGAIIHDETVGSLKSALIEAAPILSMPASTARVDGATSFCAVAHDPTRIQVGITDDYGCLKHKNKNAAINKNIQKLEQELLHLESNSKETTKAF